MPVHPAHTRDIARLFAGRQTVSIKEAAEALSVSRENINRRIDEGVFISFKVGGRRVIQVASIRRTLADTVGLPRSAKPRSVQENSAPTA